MSVMGLNIITLTFVNQLRGTGIFALLMPRFLPKAFIYLGVHLTNIEHSISQSKY